MATFYHVVKTSVSFFFSRSLTIAAKFRATPHYEWKRWTKLGVAMEFGGGRWEVERVRVRTRLRYGVEHWRLMAMCSVVHTVLITNVVKRKRKDVKESASLHTRSKISPFLLMFLFLCFCFVLFFFVLFCLFRCCWLFCFYLFILLSDICLFVGQEFFARFIYDHFCFLFFY